MKKSVLLFSFILLCIVSAVSVGVSIYLYTNAQKIVTSKEPELSEEQTMIATLNNAMVLPEEKPTIISVTDREKLQDQEFFKKAQNGDKVVIYESIRRIFLYRPALKKIIDVAPLVYNQPKTATVSATPAISPTKQATSSSSVVGEEEQGDFHLQQ